MDRRFSMWCQSAVLAGVTAAALLGTPVGATAQAFKDLQAPDTPLVLKAQGSFFIGGEKSEQTRVELGGLGPGGYIAVNQMYVRYMVPQDGDGNVPVVMVHGATLTGKSWETTPDGRMGWDEYFVRKGHPVYVPDQVGRGRSGFNQAVFNDVRAGSTPAGNLPNVLRFSDEVVWPNFRFGSKPSAPYPDSQFPLTAVDELSKQGVPDLNFGGLPTPNPTLKALSDLAAQVSGAVLMGHSQSGSFPLAAALLDPTAAKGLVLVEPGRCPANYTAEQVKTLASIPILVVFGDHRDTPTGISTRPSWQESFDSCQELIGRVKAAGGHAEMLNPPDRGIRGNSHMIMQDKNNLQIADLILQWIADRVSAIRPASSQPSQDRIVRVAELEIDPDQLNAYRTALKEEISAAIQKEPGVLTLYAVSLKGHPEKIRLFETYSNAASYQSHLQSSHFKKYKEQTRQMVKSLTLLETDPILLGSKPAASAATPYL